MQTKSFLRIRLCVYFGKFTFTGMDVFPAEAAPIYTVHEAPRGYCPRGWGGGGNGQSIGSIDLSLTPLSVAGCAAGSWATRNCPLGHFCSFTSSS